MIIDIYTNTLKIESKRAKHGESLSEHDETLTDSSFEIPS